MPSERIQFRPGPLAPAINARVTGGAGAANDDQVAARDLGRYYDLMALALASVDLTLGEASLMVDATNGTMIDLTTAQMLAAEIADSLEDGLAEKWDVDGRALVAKINGWSLAQRLAVCDAVERFWGAGYQVGSTGDRLAAVGLIRRG